MSFDKSIQSCNHHNGGLGHHLYLMLNPLPEPKLSPLFTVGPGAGLPLPEPQFLIYKIGTIMSVLQERCEEAKHRVSTQ